MPFTDKQIKQFQNFCKKKFGKQVGKKDAMESILNLATYLEIALPIAQRIKQSKLEE